MPLVEARGVTFHTQELGATPPSLVMLHGLFTGSVATWYFTAAPALARARRVLLYDLRGHGRSERTPTGYDLASMATDLEALAERFAGGASEIDLVGHCYGALVALRFALRRPARVRRLALVEAPLPPARLDDLAARMPVEMADALLDPVRAGLTPTGRQALRFIGSVRFHAGASSLLADVLGEPDIPDEVLGRLSCPTLCLYGDRSSCRSTGERLAQVIPGARLEVLPGGHQLHLDATRALTTLLMEFLDG